MRITESDLVKIRKSKYYSKMFQNLNDVEVKNIVEKWLRDIKQLNIKNMNWDLKRVLFR
jgi:hypothetical protein